jgi:hypothetical protein
MRHANWLVFDDYVQPAGSVVFTSQDLNSKLGTYDQLAIQAVVDNVAGGGAGFKVQIFHSSDGRNWLAKNATGVPLVAGPAELGGSSGFTLSTSGVNNFHGFDPVPGGTGVIPGLALVQLGISLGVSTGAHVRIHVTARDWGGR